MQVGAMQVRSAGGQRSGCPEKFPVGTELAHAALCFVRMCPNSAAPALPIY
jgi:hypothetical protein